MENEAKDAIMSLAWASFVQFAANEPEIVEAYNKETGSDYGKVLSPIEASIDRATGFEDEQQFLFTRWVTENHWGMEHAPKKFVEDCQRRDAEKAEVKE